MLCVGLAGGPALASEGAAEGEKTSRISDDAVPQIDPEAVPERPTPLLELGNPFLGTGTLHPGFRIPGGAVWQPSLLLFGTYRTALQSSSDGSVTLSEWVNRLELFANLQLSGTERLLVGVRPVDADGRFSGYRFNPGPGETVEEFNLEVTTLFFEGYLGGLIPASESRRLAAADWGFAVGRQPLSVQGGMLIADSLDAIGIIRDAILPRGGSDLQLTFLYGWNDIHRDDNTEDDDAQLLGLFAAADYPRSTFNADLVYVFDSSGDRDGLYWGLSRVARLGHLNTSVRLLGSYALDEETEAVSDGYLLFGELSWTPAWSHNLAYVNAFWGIDRFSSAARGPDAGGPLGATGILFAAVGMGTWGPALGNRADDSAGAALGYQMFSSDTRRQAIFEVGARQNTNGVSDGSVAVGARLQQAIGRHLVLRTDAYGSIQESRDDTWGLRFEVRYEF